MPPSDLSCPSARPDLPDAVMFGVIGGTVEAPSVGYLTEAVEVTDDLLELAEPVTPMEVFRFAGTCAEHGCQQFENGQCSIAKRLVSLTEPVVGRVPRCAIRPSCRWFAEHGTAACVRCPAVVTVNHAPAPDAVAVAGKPGATAGSASAPCGSG
jgi:hypothetical protein